MISKEKQNLIFTRQDFKYHSDNVKKQLHKKISPKTLWHILSSPTPVTLPKLLCQPTALKTLAENHVNSHWTSIPESVLLLHLYKLCVMRITKSLVESAIE